jgi:hypothetical protein
MTIAPEIAISKLFVLYYDMDNKTLFSFVKPMRTYQNNLSQLFLAFVKSADVRNDVLKWCGDCLADNRGKLFIVLIK